MRRRGTQLPRHRSIHQLRNMRQSLIAVAGGLCGQQGGPCSECVHNAYELVCDFLETLPAGQYTAAEIIDAVMVAAHD